MINKNKAHKIRYLMDALLIDDEILVFGDVHIGYEINMEGMGVFPKVQFKEIIEKLDGIFKILINENIVINQIIILGDLKHEFGNILDLEWSESLKLLDYLDSKVYSDKKTDRIVLIKGNHDNILKPIANKRNLKVRDYYKTRGICFVHGDRFFKQCLNSEVLIMGHLHPAITISDKYKSEKYKCFLKGKWEGKLVYILPNFSPISYGYDLSGLLNIKRDFSFIKNKYLKNFDIIIYNEKEDEEYHFGKVKKLIGNKW